MVYIYGLFDPRNNKLRYVGKAKNPKQRLYYHVREIEGRSSFTHKEAWIKQLINSNCYPILEILEEVNDEDWKNAEQWWIDLTKNIGYKLTNMTDGGDGFSSGPSHYLYGKHISEEQKKNLSINRMGANNPMYGKTGGNKGRIFSQEHRERLKQSHLGKKKSADTRFKMILAHKRNKPLQIDESTLKERGKKVSAALKGRKLTDEQRMKYLFSMAMNYCFKKGKINSIYILQKEYYIKYGHYNMKYPILS